MLKEYLETSLESINHQYDGLLLKELSTHFNDYRLDKVRDQAQAKSVFQKRMKKAILDRTGLNVNLRISGDAHLNAWVRTPVIDRNHPLLSDFIRFTSKKETKDLYAVIRDGGAVFNGTVDRKRAKVSGVFSEIEFTVGMTRGFIETDIFTSEELAAIVIHELGHPFSYFEYLGTTVTTNYVLSELTRRLNGVQESKRRIQIVKETCEVIDVDLEDPEALVSTNNDMVIQTVVLRKAIEKRISELDSHSHDITAWEMLSDQFVSRHGGGRALVTGLDKYYRKAKKVPYSTFDYHYAEMVKMLVLLRKTLIFAPIAILAAMAIVDTNESLYDKPKARMERIKRDMNDGLKDQTLPPETTQQIIEDIEAIDHILEEMKDRRTYLQFFWSTFRTKGRRNYQQMKFQQELEILASNEIFTRAAKLRTIKL